MKGKSKRIPEQVAGDRRENVKEPPKTVTEWFWETGPDHRFTYLSSQNAVVTGFSTSRIIGRRREDFGIDRDDPKWKRHLADLAAHRPFWGFEYPIKLPDGRIIHLSVSGEPRFDDKGRFLGYRGAASDITQRKRMEEDLRDARDLFEAVLNHTPFGIALKDKKGRYLKVSREWQRRFGLTREQAAGKMPSEILSPDLAQIYEMRDDITLRQGKQIVAEDHLKGPGGTDEYFLTVRFPIRRQDGTITGMGLISADITDRKLAEMKQAESEQQIRAIADNLPVLISRHDSQWRHQFINREGASWYGMTPEELVGKSVPDLLSRETCDLIRPLIDRVLRGEATHFSGTIEYPDGNARRVMINYVPDFAADGSVQGLFSLAVDETEREMAERALSKNEQRLTTITDNLPVLITSYDREGRFEFMNRAGEEWYGRPTSEIVGKKVTEIFGAESSAKVKPWMDRALKGERVRFEDRLLYPDGIYRDVDIAYIPDATPDGEVRGCIALVQNITKRKEVEGRLQESEARLRAIVDNLPAFIIYADSDQRFRFANRTAEEWYGMPASEIIGRRISEIVPPASYEKLSPRIELVLSGQNVRLEDTLPYPDGITRIVDQRWIADHDEDGNTRGWFALGQDITERKRLEADLLRQERLATLGQLTGTVAHELRNPLGAVAASVAALRRKTAEAGLDVERSLGRAERGIWRCERIITELLDFARAKGLQRQPTRINDWLEGVIAELETPAGIGLSADLSGCDTEMSIDREDMRRAIINLIDNACQAILGNDGLDAPPEGRISLECRASGDRLICEISDSGPGIPADTLERVMEPLFSTKSFGTGLGLPTVQRIIEAHGGGMRLDSRPGEGATVQLWLPLDAES